MTDDQIIDDILRREGWPTFTNRVTDRGGPTKGGITLATLTGWRQKMCSVDDLRALSEAEARQIYQDLYFERPGYDDLRDPRLKAVMADCAVLHGPRQATRFLQRAINRRHESLAEDGLCGPKTKEAANAAEGWTSLPVRVTAERLRFLGRFITDHPKQAEYAAGWMNRIAEFLD